MRIRVHLIALTCMGTLMLSAPNLQGASANQELSNFSASLGMLTKKLVEAASGMNETEKKKGIECPVCGEEKPLLCLKKCGHCQCASCWYKYLIDKIYEKDIPTRCFELRCPTTLTPDNIRLIQAEFGKLPKTQITEALQQTSGRFTFEKKLEKISPPYVKNKKTLPDLTTRYQNVLSEKEVKADPNKQFCATPECTGILQIPNDHKGMAQCKVCEKWQCFECGLQHDKTKTCNQARKENPDKYIGALYTKFNSKKCPNPKCGAGVEKSVGCLHMTCKNCGHEYCWKCMKPWSMHGDSWGCPNVLDDTCAVCKRKFKDDDKKFVIHQKNLGYAQHSAHPACLLEWLEVDPDEGLLFDPKKLTFSFYLPTDLDKEKRAVISTAEPTPIPGMFSCPHCALKVQIELSPDKNQLLFKDIVLVEKPYDSDKFVYYKKKSEKQQQQKPGWGETDFRPRALDLTLKAKAADFFDDLEKFEKSLTAIPEKCQGVYRALYNKTNEIWETGKKARIAPPKKGYRPSQWFNVRVEGNIPKHAGIQPLCTW